ncbi:MAG: hypothetical protein ACJAS1_004343 [Oleiphilaceae bacterium]|jgi:hypothetical protein
MKRKYFLYLKGIRNGSVKVKQMSLRARIKGLYFRRSKWIYPVSPSDGKATDDKIAINMVVNTQKNLPNLKSCSFDIGFHSRTNQVDSKALLELIVLPKKGRLSKEDKTRKHSDDFQVERRQHSAVESGINALEVHGLDKCPDQGIEGFKRYVALALLARNIQSSAGKDANVSPDSSKIKEIKPTMGSARQKNMKMNSIGI